MDLTDLAKRKQRGCSDGRCIFRPPRASGQHTNGGCTCLKQVRTAADGRLLAREVADYWRSAKGRRAPEEVWTLLSEMEMYFGVELRRVTLNDEDETVILPVSRREFEVLFRALEGVEPKAVDPAKLKGGG